MCADLPSVHLFHSFPCCVRGYLEPRAGESRSKWSRAHELFCGDVAVSCILYLHPADACSYKHRNHQPAEKKIIIKPPKCIWEPSSCIGCTSTCDTLTSAASIALPGQNGMDGSVAPSPHVLSLWEKTTSQRYQLFLQSVLGVLVV